jgi:hypothetical protein
VVRLSERVPGFDYRKSCKQHGENGMAEQTIVSAAGHGAMDMQRLSIANDSARLNLARLTHRGYLVTESTPEQAVCGDAVVHAEVATSQFRGAYP